MKNIVISIGVAIIIGLPLSVFGTTPKLVVVIAYDQMRGDYLDKFQGYWGEGGFARIAREGSIFKQAYFTHATTFTAAGHATIMTGVNPARHGVIANDFFDKEYGRTIYSCEDTVSSTIGNSGVKRSPANLQMPTLGDRLKETFPTSKVIGIAQKDRSSILMAGKTADAAYWYDIKAAGMTTSSYYMDTLPLWVQTWKKENPLDRYSGKVWEAGQFRYEEPDDAPWEGKFPQGERYFPHRMPLLAEAEEAFNSAFLMSPFSVEYLFDFAKTTLEVEQLGKRGTPDILCISISTTDITGHQFGPDSRELMEIFRSCDTLLSLFIAHLDAEYGRDNYITAISSDHGVGMVPERAQATGRGGGRIAYLDIAEGVEEYLAVTFPRTSEKPWIRAIEIPWIHLTDDSLTKAMFDFNTVSDSLSAFLMRTFDGLYCAVPAYTLEQNLKPDSLSDDDFNFIRNSYFRQRCGEVAVYQKENWLFGSIAASHGTPHAYDRHVPLYFFGGGVPAFATTKQVAVVDLVPTLAAILGLHFTETDGKKLDFK